MQALTPLENATRDGDLSKVKRHLEGKLLRTANSMANKKGHLGWTLLHHASFQGREDTVLYLIEKCRVEVNATNNLGDTAIYCTCSAGRADIVRSLLSKGADAQLPNLRGSTPLHVAAVQGHLEIVKLLVRDGQVNVHMKEMLGATALHGACYRGHVDVARYLIEVCRASVNSQNKAGNTPLHLACTANQLEMVMYLVESCRANVNAKNTSRLAPLHVAVRRGFLQMVQFLVVHGKAEVNEPDSVNKTTVLDVAKIYGHSQIVVFLLKYAVPDTVVLADDVDSITRLTAPYDDLASIGDTGEKENIDDDLEIPAVVEFGDIVSEDAELTSGTTSVPKEGLPTPDGRPSLVEESAGYDNGDDVDQRALVERIENLEGLLQRVANLEAQLLGGSLPNVVASLATRLERLEQATGMLGSSNLTSLPEMPPVERESMTATIGNTEDDDDCTAE